MSDFQAKMFKFDFLRRSPRPTSCIEGGLLLREAREERKGKGRGGEGKEGKGQPPNISA